MLKGKSSKRQRDKRAKGQCTSPYQESFNLKTKKKKEHKRLENSSGSELETYQDVHSGRRFLIFFLKKTAGRKAEAAMDTWIFDAMGSGIPLPIRLAEAIDRYRKEILNHHAHKVFWSL
jgi:transposase